MAEYRPPKWEHDCHTCKYLGNLKHEDVDYDLYFCSYEPTVIARFGTQGDYLSGLPFINHNPLREAALRAIEAGMLNPKIETGGAGQGTVEEYLVRTAGGNPL